jgi:hypothetical protein
MTNRPIAAFFQAADGGWYGPDIDPGDIKDYRADLGCLLSAGEALASAVWSADSGITLMTGQYQSSIAANTATVWLSAEVAVVGATYNVTGTFVTNNVPPRQFERSFKIRCRNL